MIFEFKPYPSYKLSGIEWLGDVPENWEIIRLKLTVRGCINGTWGNDSNGQDDLICVRVADFDRLHLKIGLNQKTIRAIPRSERGRRLLRKGDLLLEKSGGGIQQPVGAVMLYNHDDLAVCSNFVARMPVADHCYSCYLAYLHSILYAIRLNVRSIRQTTGIQNLDSCSYLSEHVAIPPIAEQTTIADFLDHKTTLIDRLIEKKQEKIKLLEEYKQAIIHQAVTGRIDVRTGQPYQAYKPSGIEWLADVPEHWEIMRLKSIVHQISEKDDKLQEGLPYVALENVESWTGRVTLNCTETTESKLKFFEEGDILFGKLRPYLAKVTCSKFRGQCVGEFLVLRTTDRLSHHFLEHLLRSKPVIDWINSSTFGAKMPRTDWHFVGNTRLGVPSLPEQTSISRFLDDVIADINKFANHTKDQIELLREYRTRLIADAVTGRIDVREAAEELRQTNSVICDDEANSTLSEQH